MDKHTQRKRAYMHSLRQSLRRVKADPYLPEAVDLAVEMYKWNKKNDSAVFVVYSRSQGKVNWNTEYCKWVTIYFNSHFTWRMWEAVNNVLHYCRSTKTSS